MIVSPTWVEKMTSSPLVPRMTLVPFWEGWGEPSVSIVGVAVLQIESSLADAELAPTAATVAAIIERAAAFLNQLLWVLTLFILSPFEPALRIQWR